MNIDDVVKSIFNFPDNKTILLLTVQNTQLASFVNDQGFTETFYLCYSEGESKLPDGEYSSNLFEFGPPVMAGFIGPDGVTPRVESKKYIQLKK